MGRNRAVLESGAENSGILENGVEKSGILENGAENRTFLKTGPKYGKRAGTQRRGSSENRARKWVFMKMVVENSWPGKGGLRK